MVLAEEAWNAIGAISLQSPAGVHPAGNAHYRHATDQAMARELRCDHQVHGRQVCARSHFLDGAPPPPSVRSVDRHLVFD